MKELPKQNQMRSAQRRTRLDQYPNLSGIESGQFWPLHLKQRRYACHAELSEKAALESQSRARYWPVVASIQRCQFCTDWEMGQSYRNWRDEYAEEWETAFRQTYEDKMMQRDAHFYVGTVHRRRPSGSSWVYFIRRTRWYGTYSGKKRPPTEAA
jgi:hypothetical protein